MTKTELLCRIAPFLQELRDDLGLTIREFAAALDVSPGSITAYLAGRELPSLEVIVRIAKLGGVTVDELVNSGKKPSKDMIVTVHGRGIVGAVAGGNVGDVHVYNNTVVRPINKYTYQPGDLTEAQAAELTRLVNEIVALETALKQRPKKQGSVWSAFKQHFQLANYRRFPTERFEEAKAYLESWRGRLKGMKRFSTAAPDEFRKTMYRDIHTIAKVELKWASDYLRDWLFDHYAKDSLRDLDDAALRQVKQKLVYMKKSKRQSVQTDE